MGTLEGKIAVVTGGTTGIGFATAKRFVEDGAYVFITGRRQPELDAAVKAIGRNVTGVQGDVSKLADLDRLYAQVKEEKGRIDVLFANAGGGEFLRLGEITEEHFDKTFGNNVKGLLFSVQKALPLFTNGGSILLNASIAGSKGMEAFSVYSATKAAVRSFARSWVIDLKGTGIRVNAISPGPIETPALDGLAGGNAEQATQLKSQLTGMIPIGRIGQGEDIANAASFLASDASSFITGTELFVDGGAGQI